MKRDSTRRQHDFAGAERNRLPYLLNFTHLVRRSPESGGMRRHLRWGMDYHFRRAGEFSLDGSAWRPREPRTAHLYAPGTAYWERSTARDVPFTETYVVFLAEESPELDALVAPGRGFARFRDEAGVLAAVFSRMMKSDAGGSRLWSIQGALFEMLDVLLGARATGPGEYEIGVEPVAPPQTLSGQVDAIIRECYDQALTLDDLARRTGVSRSTLTHRYRAETGTTPFARLHEHRLEVGRGMLLKGERAKEIAVHTGFYDEYHFAKAFKRRFGLPPRRYARKSQPDAALT
jgi:AraC-like DNA-binding protein